MIATLTVAAAVAAALVLLLLAAAGLCYWQMTYVDIGTGYRVDRRHFASDLAGAAVAILLVVGAAACDGPCGYDDAGCYDPALASYPWQGAYTECRSDGAVMLCASDGHCIPLEPVLPICGPTDDLSGPLEGALACSDDGVAIATWRTPTGRSVRVEASGVDQHGRVVCPMWDYSVCPVNDHGTGAQRPQCWGSK